MPGRRPRGFHEGDRAEYIARYALSAFAQVVPVPRQEDYGIDFLCSLTTMDDKSLFVEDVFGVQVKKLAKARKGIVYGGHDKRGNWKKYEIEWLLFGSAHPLLIVLVDIGRCRVDLYSTANMWYVRWKVGWPFKVRLLPSMEDGQLSDPIAAPDPSATSASGDHGDRNIWNVPLGPPIVSLLATNCADPVISSQAYLTLKGWLSLDQRNVTHQQLSIPFCERFKIWSPNKKPEEHERRMFGNPDPSMNVADILETISPMIHALGFNFERQKDDDMVHLKGILRLLEKYDLLYEPGRRWL